MSAREISELIREIHEYVNSLAFAGKANVCAGLCAAREAAQRAAAPCQLAVSRKHLPAALASMCDDGYGRLATAIGAATPHLGWTVYDVYPAAEIGEFAIAHAFASVIGEEAPVFARDYELGLFLIAPNTFYRDHMHAAPELYAPLTGPHRWRFDVDDEFASKPAHVPVWNEPWQVHATHTGATPFLCIFCWTRDVHQPARIVFSKSDKPAPT